MQSVREIVLFSTVLGTLMILAAGFWGFLLPTLVPALAPLLAFGFVLGTVIYGIVNG